MLVHMFHSSHGLDCGGPAPAQGGRRDVHGCLETVCRAVAQVRESHDEEDAGSGGLAGRERD